MKECGVERDISWQNDEKEYIKSSKAREKKQVNTKEYNFICLLRMVDGCFAEFNNNHIYN